MERSNQEPSDSQETAEEQIREIASRNPAMKWDKELVILVYILSVSLDPLLLYSLILNKVGKCVIVDGKLEKIVIVLRLLADLSCIGHIIYEISGEAKRLRKEIPGLSTSETGKMLMKEFWWQSSISMAILAALPVPQIAIFVFFPKLRASGAWNGMWIMNYFIMLQYVPRIYSIYRHCKNLNKEKLDNYISGIERKTWVPGFLNFILYILASYVLGAFWYFFSIQRQIDCWGIACQQSENGCGFLISDCDDSILRNVTLLNNLCHPLNGIFDFGIYLEALQSGMFESRDLWPKVLDGFSWGVRNLSSFGSNLIAKNGPDILFVVLVSVSGLLLFVYLLGHLQTFMQATNKKYWIRLKMRKIELDIERMSDEYGLSNNREDIHKIVRRRLQREEDLAVENIFSILPLDVRNIIKRHLLLPKLKEVPTLQGIDQKVLVELFLDHLEQVIYDGGNYIIREGEPLDMMIFISRGSVLTYNTSSTGHGGGGSGLSNTIGRLTRDDLYGQELMSWAATSTSFSDLPISNKTLKSHEKVEVFAIRASALLRIVSEHEEYFKTETQRPYPTDITLIEIN